MNFTANQPSMIYYLALYILVFMIRFIKVMMELPRVSERDSSVVKKFQWWHLTFVSLEIVYTSSGFIILLLGKLKEWTSVILIIYVIIVIASTSLDAFRERFGDRPASIGHLLIILLIIFSLFISFNYFLVEESCASRKPKNIATGTCKKFYRIAIPYTDESLALHLGKMNFGDRRLVFVQDIEANNENKAMQIAMDSFKKNAVSQPFKPRGRDKTIQILSAAITVERFD